jgi:hypothetical protein
MKKRNRHLPVVTKNLNFDHKDEDGFDDDIKIENFLFEDSKLSIEKRSASTDVGVV